MRVSVCVPFPNPVQHTVWSEQPSSKRPKFIVGDLDNRQCASDDCMCLPKLPLLTAFQNQRNIEVSMHSQVTTGGAELRLRAAARSIETATLMAGLRAVVGRHFDKLPRGLFQLVAQTFHQPPPACIEMSAGHPVSTSRNSAGERLALHPKRRGFRLGDTMKWATGGLQPVLSLSLASLLCACTGHKGAALPREFDAAALPDAGAPDATAPNGDSACEGARTRCGPYCVDVDFDRLNCGACGAECEFECVNGMCVNFGCKSQNFCDGACRDYGTDRQHCGACFSPCDGSRSCEGGECVCPPGDWKCQGIEPEPCGMSVCKADEICSAAAVCIATGTCAVNMDCSSGQTCGKESKRCLGANECSATGDCNGDKICASGVCSAPPLPRPQGFWQGYYSCAGNNGGAQVEVNPVSGNGSVTGIVRFRYFDRGSNTWRQGSYNVSGSYSNSDRALSLSPGTWIEAPPSSVAMGLSGTLSQDGSQYNGAFTGPVCQAFSFLPGKAVGVAFPSGSRWAGGYRCSDNDSEGSLVLSERDGAVSGTFGFRYFSSRNGIWKQGSYSVAGTYWPKFGTLELTPGAWIERPQGTIQIGMAGAFTSGGYVGHITGARCDAFNWLPSTSN